MKTKASEKQKTSIAIIVLMVLSVALWVYCFKDFFAGRLVFTTDAVPYYEHNKFFIDSLLQRQYPLWDATWDGGAPNEFFLRRMGEANPFYGIIIFFRSIGFSAYLSYSVFLVFYYFLGIYGFYFVSKHLFRSQLVAFFSFMVLAFSSFGTMVFSSYLYLLFGPMIWFVYFILSAQKKPSRFAMLGAVFCLMLLVSTYIPFYFLLILGVLAILEIGLFPKRSASFVKQQIAFMRSNKVFTVFCLGALLLACLPSAWMYVETLKGYFVLPTRHFNAPVKNLLGVPIQRSDFGGIIPHYVVSEVFKNFKSMFLSRVYVPIFALLVLAVGMFARLSKKTILICCLAFFFFVIGIYDAPVYKFLYENVFFFKYLRNFQFFFWLVVLPAFVFIVSDHFMQFWKADGRKKRNILFIVWSLLVHIAAGLFFYKTGTRMATVYVTLFLSQLFFLTLFLEKKPRLRLAVFLVFALVVLQSLEVYYWLQKNADPKRKPYRYEWPYKAFQYTRDAQVNPIFDIPFHAPAEKSADQEPKKKTFHIYYGTKWYNQLLHAVDQRIFRDYIRYKFYLYDQVVWLEPKHKKWKDIQKSLAQNENLAFITAEKQVLDSRVFEKRTVPSPFVEILSEPSSRFAVETFTVNSISCRSRFQDRKFLVYTDNYYPGWRAFIDGKRVDLFRANVAFKGIWVPSGEHVIEFRFGAWYTYALKWLEIGLFGLCLILLIFEAGYEKKLNQSLREET